jgi:lipoprotein-anchoring transpeptidase ErfK/SrfK
MPEEAPQFADDAKAIVVDLPGQVFGAYEHGRLIRWGPVSTGSEQHATPSGMYHLDWKSRLRVSSVDPTWIMPYYYNFSHIGLGMHEYVMEGRPASHGCVRLLRDDAVFIFDWGAPGTPVWIVGEYHFRQPKPWLDPAWWNEGVRLPGRAVT